MKGTLREGSFTGNSESYVRHVKEGFEMEHPSLYSLCEGNRREDSYTKDSKRCVMESSRNRGFLL